ncbi:hypothetical protein DL769_009795 [Monosporascus sp. CRB-8-3]|nr:hypothetical protein DL769_009795 [Monosporascus sp. CRB-8-3]
MNRYNLLVAQFATALGKQILGNSAVSERNQHFRLRLDINGIRLSTTSIACSGSLYVAEPHDFAAPAVECLFSLFSAVAATIVRTSPVTTCAVSALAGVGAAPALAVAAPTTLPALDPAGVKRLRNESLGPESKSRLISTNGSRLLGGARRLEDALASQCCRNNPIIRPSAEHPRRAAARPKRVRNGTPNGHQAGDGNGNQPSAPLRFWIRSHRDSMRTRSLPRLLRKSVADRGLLPSNLKPSSSRRTRNLQCDTLASVEEQRLASLEAKAAKARMPKTVEAIVDDHGNIGWCMAARLSPPFPLTTTRIVRYEDPFLDSYFNLPDSTNLLRNPSIRV